MNDIIEAQDRAPVVQPQQAAPATPAAIIMYAMQSGAPMSEIRELMQLKREWEADEARKAYVVDMANFKKNPPTITKDKHVEFKTGSGVTSYDHATIGNVTNKIIAALAEHGFSHAWNTEQRDGLVIVTCTITHRQGHSERVTLQANPDSSGGKNGIQSIISAQTYLQRHSLLAATGLATHDQPDDDGQQYGTTDTRLADFWLAKVAAAKSDAEVVKVWEEGVGPIEASKDTHAFDEFKKAVGLRRAEFTRAAKGGA